METKNTSLTKYYHVKNVGDLEKNFDKCQKSLQKQQYLSQVQELINNASYTFQNLSIDDQCVILFFTGNLVKYYGSCLQKYPTHEGIEILFSKYMENMEDFINQSFENHLLGNSQKIWINFFAGNVYFSIKSYLASEE